MLMFVMNLGFAASGTVTAPSDLMLYDEGFSFSLFIRF